MPPQPKFSKDEIVDAALSIVSEEGVSALTARRLADRLGSSARPVFTVFSSMDEVVDAVRTEAQRRYDEYVSQASAATLAFKKTGELMLRYAKEEPKLFNLLFMQEHEGARNFDDVFAALGDAAPLSIEFIVRDYELTEAEAMALFRQLWVFTYGLSVLCATRMCVFSDDELSQMLTEEFIGAIACIKGKEA